MRYTILYRDYVGRVRRKDNVSLRYAREEAQRKTRLPGNTVEIFRGDGKHRVIYSRDKYGLLVVEF